MCIYIYVCVYIVDACVCVCARKCNHLCFILSFWLPLFARQMPSNITIGLLRGGMIYF